MITTVRELRASTKAILSAVDRGDTVLITKRGKPCAKIIAVEKKKTQKKDDALFGIWKDKKDIRSVKDYVHKLREGRYAR